MVIWGGLYTVCGNLSEGPLSFVGWWSDPMLEQPFWSGQPLCALCVCQKCTVVSKEQLEDQLLHHLGSSEGDGRRFHWFGTWCDAFGQFLLSHSVSCQRRWEKVWGPARNLISHHFWWVRGPKGCHYVRFDLSGFRGTCLFQRPPQLTMSKALVRSLKATYRSMLCSQHFYFNWYSTKIVSTVLLLVRKLHWLMESVCSAIVGVSWSRSTLARSCQLWRGRWCLCNCSNRICLLYSCRGRQWQHLWGPVVPLYLLTLPAGNEPRSEMTAWKAS